MLGVTPITVGDFMALQLGEMSVILPFLPFTSPLKKPINLQYALSAG
jgi:hypothetical protein